MVWPLRPSDKGKNQNLKFCSDLKNPNCLHFKKRNTEYKTKSHQNSQLKKKKEVAPVPSQIQWYSHFSFPDVILTTEQTFDSGWSVVLIGVLCVWILTSAAVLFPFNQPEF